MSKRRWKMVRLGDICIIQAGGTPSRGNVSYWKNGEIPWIKIGDIKGKYTLSATEFITKGGLDNSSAKLFKPNTILYTIFATIGEVSILKFEAATNQAIAGIEIIDNNETDIDFIYYYLQSIKQNVISISRGIAQNNINLGILRNFDIPLPPLEDQKQIAATLDKASELIALRKKQLEELDVLAESVFYEMFGDPVKNEKEWKKHNLSDFYKNGKSAIKCGPFGSALKKEEYTSFGIPVWNMDNISKKGEFDSSVNLWIDDQKYKELESYNVIDGDIIISRAGTVGKMCVVKSRYSKSLISTNLIRLRLDKNKLLPLHFVFLMTLCGNKVCRLKVGEDGSFTHMNTGILNSITFPYPPINLQTRFAAIIEKIKSQKVLAKQALQESEDLFQRLMQDLFNPD